ncbi:helix-turn-helix domain-containing protein [Nonomuraea longispora]|uniref:Helix-turn-helix domain-containing protein n=1 Tax=Nonomuraea longispora TaxID=1848320 RepID=A0A4R4NB50_9ACTN|nr:helix-turn-helix domain-containing protein [Nonomuraea longispora]TDC03802.1 helix-turn-helix domain-containing protein [Nonomuraea longispora]
MPLAKPYDEDRLDDGLPQPAAPVLKVRDTTAQFGAVTVSRRSFEPLRLWRAAEHPVDPGLEGTCQLLVPLAGSLQVIWAEGHATPGVGDLLVHDMTHVLAARFRAPERGLMFEAALVDVPRSLVSLPAHQVEAMLGSIMPATRGIGALLASVVTGLAENPDSYRPADGPRLGMVVLDLVSALFAHAIETSPALPASNRDALLLRVQAFVQEHLRDPGLSPRSLAVQHHISASYLHRLFQDQGITVGGYIRAQRLDRARRDLADPALRAVPIHSIAAKWGFSHAADFSRAFRREYGVSPRDFRREAIRTAPR